MSVTQTFGEITPLPTEMEFVTVYKALLGPTATPPRDDVFKYRDVWAARLKIQRRAVAWRSQKGVV